MATKRYEHQKCYIYDMPKHMYKPDEVKEGVKKVKHQAFSQLSILFSLLLLPQNYYLLTFCKMMQPFINFYSFCTSNHGKVGLQRQKCV